MDMNAIEVSHLTKTYRLYNSPRDRLCEILSLKGRKYHHEFYALHNVSFAVEKGQTFGIIGQNGSGKSTLLKIISGVVQPTFGNVNVNGRVASLLELGAGFHPEFAGRENVYMNGAFLGLSRAEIDRRFPDIETFADIGEFIDQPVKTYSSGMYVRLAFAAAINIDPDILIIDEVLAVGDIRFQRKCFAKMEEFRLSEKTIIFVSHDTASIVNLCHKVVWIDKGQIVKIGNPKEIAEDYLAAMYKDIHDSKGVSRVDIANSNLLLEPTNLTVIDDRYKSFGVNGARLTGFAFEAKEKEQVGVVYGGDEICLTLEINAHVCVEKPIVGFQVYDKVGNVIFGINTDMVENKLPRMEAGIYIIKFNFIWPHLSSRYYSISPAIADGGQQDHIMHHWVHDVLIIQSLQRIKSVGLIGISEARVSFHKHS